jgi:hypothetical protein
MPGKCRTDRQRPHPDGLQRTKTAHARRRFETARPMSGSSPELRNKQKTRQK